VKYYIILKVEGQAIKMIFAVNFLTWRETLLKMAGYD